MAKEIPELDIKLTSIEVNAEVVKLRTLRDWYENANFFGKIKYLWYWYWHVSEIESWDGYLKRQWTWTAVYPDEIKGGVELVKTLNEQHRLTENNRWDLLRKYYKENSGQVQWDRMSIPSHEWFDNYHIKTPRCKAYLKEDEVKYLELVNYYREEDKKIREQYKKENKFKDLL